jgi:small subunit ribosomal protein S20
MANTSSAKKAVRNSEKKRIHNLGWKKRIKASMKNLVSLAKDNAPIAEIVKSISQAQKVLDKASKENVIHKNKANRIKSNLAKKFGSQQNSGELKTSKSKKSPSKKSNS